MRNLYAVVLIAAALGAGMTNAQTPPAAAPARTVKAIQPGLLEVTGPRVNDAVGAGIQKITAVPGKKREIHRQFSRHGATSTSIGPRM